MALVQQVLIQVKNPLQDQKDMVNGMAVGGDIAVKVWQQGVHSGQQVETQWVLTSWETGKRYTQYLKYDYDGASTFKNVSYGSYSLT